MCQVFELIATVRSAENFQNDVRHLVTLQHPETMDEVAMVIDTKTNGFCDVLREVNRSVAVLWLESSIDYRAYRYYEACELSDSF